MLEPPVSAVPPRTVADWSWWLQALCPPPEVVLVVEVVVAVVAVAVAADSDAEVESVAVVVAVVVAFLPFWNLGIEGLCQVCDCFCDSPSLG